MGIEPAPLSRGARILLLFTILKKSVKTSVELTQYAARIGKRSGEKGPLIEDFPIVIHYDG